MGNTKITAELPLLVPIQLDGFIAANGKGLFKNLAPDLDNLKNYNSYGGLGIYVEKDVNQNNNTSFYTKNPGVHLHWVLPRNFRHGVYKANDDALQFPLAPNRWLLIRSDAQLELKAWMVESDFIDKAATQGFNWLQVNEVALNGSNVKQYTPVKAGRAVPLNGWTETNPSSLFLSLVAPGDPGFAAAYLHSGNMLGFYDNMQDVKGNGPFTYRVYGWFSDVSKDPLNGLADAKAFLQKLGALGWSLPGADTMPELPGSVLCHATIYGLTYDQNAPGKIPSLSDISLGIGNSPSEALSAMLVDKVSGDQIGQSQKLLAAFQYQALNDNGPQEESMNVLKKEMHKRTFRKIDGGTIWVIEEAEKKEADLKSGSAQESFRPYTSDFSGTVSALLEQLNAAQSEFNTSDDDLRSTQEQLYAALYKKNYANYGADTSKFSDDEWEKIGGTGGLIDTEIAACKASITALSSALNGLRKKVDGVLNDDAVWPGSYTGKIPGLYSQLVAALSADPAMKGYQVKEVPDDKFYQAAEPAVVINGLRPASRYINNDRVKSDPETGNTTIEKDTILCRVPAGIIDNIEVDFDGNHYKVNAGEVIPASTILAIDPNNAAILNKVAGLFQESLLLDPVTAETIAYVIKKLAGDMSAPELDKLKGQISATQQNFENSADKFFNGTLLAQLPEKFSVSVWAQPWIPLFLEWGIQWLGTPAGPAGPGYLASWTFGDKTSRIDYALTNNNLQNTAIYYSGRTILSPEMVNKVDDLNKKLSADGSSGLFQSMSPMSQNFSGFFSQLINRYYGVQLPLLNEGLNFNADNAYLSNHYPWTPQPGQVKFFPLRAGVFKVTMLRVIDAFGQVMQIIDPTLSTQVAPVFKKSAGLTAIGFNNATWYLAPPRVVQPARVRFDWLSADIEGRITDSDPATNPVCGWLLTNKLNNSIMIFDTDGVEIGELSVIRNAVQLVAPPGGSGSQKRNERLTNLIKGISGSVDNFNAMVKQLDSVVKKVQSKTSGQQFAMALPVGLPVAVAGALCTLQVKGSAARSQYWAADGADDFTGSTFKAYPGDFTSNNDGVVGYYAGKASGDMFLPYLQQKGTDVNNFQVSAGLGLQIDTPLDITVLLDPRSSVTLTCGLLPAASYELPAHAVLKPLQTINIRFLAAPVITLKKELKIPLMKSQSLEWNWIPGAPADVIAMPVKPDPDTNDLLNFDPVHATEGWLQLSPKKV